MFGSLWLSVVLVGLVAATDLDTINEGHIVTFSIIAWIVLNFKKKLKIIHQPSIYSCNCPHNALEPLSKRTPFFVYY